MRRIVLPYGKAHFTFSVELDGELINIRANWLTRYGYYIVTIEIPNQGIEVAGRSLHPNIDLLKDLQLTNLQSLFIKGDEPTPNNLGVTSNLYYGEL